MNKNFREGKPTAVGWDGMVWFARINPGFIDLEELGLSSWGPAFATTFDNEEDAHKYADKIDALLHRMTKGNTPEIPDTLKRMFTDTGNFFFPRYDPYHFNERYRAYHDLFLQKPVIVSRILSNWLKNSLRPRRCFS